MQTNGLTICGRALLIIGLMGLMACSTGSSNQINVQQNPNFDGDLLAVKQDLEREHAAAYNPPEAGSLWTDQNNFGSLFTNPKARHIGDILTIRIVESSSATNKASTQTGRSSSVSASVNNFFGLENDFSANSPFFNPFGRVSGGVESDFDGSGTTKRSGDLTATITARVVDILPNGNLIVMGSREVLVNREKQEITLSGIVRPRDISSENVVLSNYIADAKIAYSGSGIINDRQRPGWLARTIDAIWPF
ncbi:MAG: flagellar basal body L-ring protein FlgH [Desulfosarcinaceae bacterium]|nr:flagellar basal body L-ring protein FlgH [Desulfosarcinaceae bacterium]